jgi:pimeloyl-ACP methyl ester carboxylesterase
MSPSSNHGFVDANGVSLHYALAGDSGRSVVLLHELGGTLNSWDGVAPRLAEHFRVLRYDQRGAGLSEKVRQEFTNDMLVKDFEALAAALALPPPYHFVTVAAAATQALRFAEQHPERVGALVLCNPPRRSTSAPPSPRARACAPRCRPRSLCPIRRSSATARLTRPISGVISPTIRSASGLHFVL